MVFLVNSSDNVSFRCGFTMYCCAESIVTKDKINEFEFGKKGAIVILSTDQEASLYKVLSTIVACGEHMTINVRVHAW